MNNIELYKLINKIGIKEYNNKIIFSNANKIIREIVEKLIIEPNTKELVRVYKETRDNYNSYRKE